jgi:hypothetical protein
MYKLVKSLPVATEMPSKDELLHQKRKLFYLVEATHKLVKHLAGDIGKPRTWAVYFTRETRLEKMFYVSYSYHIPTNPYEQLIIASAITDAFELPRGVNPALGKKLKRNIRFYVPCTTDEGVQTIVEATRKLEEQLWALNQELNN